MQSFYDGMTLVGSLVVMVAVVALTYYASRWYAGKMSKTLSGKHIKVVDKITVSPGCAMIVAQVGNGFYLIGLGDKNIRLLCELKDFEPGAEMVPEVQAPFSQILKGFLHKAGSSEDNGVEK